MEFIRFVQYLYEPADYKPTCFRCETSSYCFKFRTNDCEEFYICEDCLTNEEINLIQD